MPWSRPRCVLRAGRSMPAPLGGWSVNKWPATCLVISTSIALAGWSVWPIKSALTPCSFEKQSQVRHWRHDIKLVCTCSNLILVYIIIQLHVRRQQAFWTRHVDTFTYMHVLFSMLTSYLTLSFLARGCGIFGLDWKTAENISCS